MGYRTEEQKQRRREKYGDKEREQQRKWRAANPEKAREYQRQQRKRRPDTDLRGNLRRSYGITLEQYKEILEQQNHHCVICGSNGHNKRAKRLHVDHCHETNKIRGLLCYLCNTALGGFLDNIQLLDNAIYYLQKHSNKYNEVISWNEIRDVVTTNRGVD